MQSLSLYHLKKGTTALKLLAATATASLLTTVFSFNTPVHTNLVQEVNSSSMTLREMEQASQIGLILSAAAVGGLAIGALQAKKGSNQETGTISLQNQNVLNINQVNGKLRAQLLTLLHKDVQAANRLLTQAKFKYPNRTTTWYAEKVIYDLTRDRGGY
jgi:hypothetical protein